MLGKVDCIVCGAGVIGITIARALTISSRFDLVVLEDQNLVGQGSSSRNSEVIHAGLYYPQKSLKSSNCHLGRKLLYNYLEENEIGFNKCGKLVVATDSSDLNSLNKIYDTALKNGCDDLKLICKDEALDMEPNLLCEKALWSPHTGVFDSHRFMSKLQHDAESKGANFVLECTVLGGTRSKDGSIIVSTNQGDIECNIFINAAGLNAPFVANKFDMIPKNKIPYPFFCKGNYFRLRGSVPFSRLIYPIPSNGGLGIHATLDMGGSMKFGPDTEWLKDSHSLLHDELHVQYPGEADDIDFIHSSPPPLQAYGVDSARAPRFYESIRRYWPALPDGSLHPDYAGIRPKLVGPHLSPSSFYLDRLGLQASAVPGDFLIQGPAEHQVKGFYSLYGIESPGLTASLAIAEHVAALISRDSGQG